jgi:hypothetical protein
VRQRWGRIPTTVVVLVATVVGITATAVEIPATAVTTPTTIVDRADGRTDAAPARAAVLVMTVRRCGRAPGAVERPPL